ncbi:MAG: thioredoxin family protein [Arenicellales bacterium]|jgi:peroxiredoxin|nr:thioredoxin family protein [Arenicellales bacterium]|tara:strand:+ start:2136 stop:2729 length:594 start_codon:yes stop_codon:yes gene_type:complete
MVSTASTMQSLGAPAPTFALPNMNPAAGEKMVSLSDCANNSALLVAFICNHCPYVIHIREALVQFVNDYAPRGLAVVAISSNDADNYPDDSPAKMSEEAVRHGFPFPYLYDEDQSVAKAYRAACTPDFFLFDSEMRLAYRGQFDAGRPKSNEPVTGVDLRNAADAVLAGSAVAAEQIPSVGCSIKWKAGGAPDYFPT